jgi:hypothetical protein
MRERGDLAGVAGAEGTAMATSPVVACICCGLRRYAIEVTCLVALAECAALFDLTRIYLFLDPTRRQPVRSRKKLDFGVSGPV